MWNDLAYGFEGCFDAMCGEFQGILFPKRNRIKGTEEHCMVKGDVFLLLFCSLLFVLLIFFFFWRY